MTDDLTPSGDAAVRLALATTALQAEVTELRTSIALAVEASYWDRPYDTRIAAIREALCPCLSDAPTHRHARGGYAITEESA